MLDARATKRTSNPSLCVLSGHFEKGVAEGAVDPSFNPVMALRLTVVKDSAVWAILSEVSQPNGLPDTCLPSHMIVSTNQFHAMLCFLPTDTHKEDSWLSLLEEVGWGGGAHDSCPFLPRGPKSPRLLTQGLWHLATNSEVNSAH